MFVVLGVKKEIPAIALRRVCLERKGTTEMHVRKTAVLFALLVSLAAASASATTINFANLQSGMPDSSLPGALRAPSVYSKQGFTIASGGNKFDVWKLGTPNFPGTLAANTSLFEFYQKSAVTIADGGKPFTLSSIYLAPLLRGGTGKFSVTFIGQIPDGPIVSWKVWVKDGSRPALQFFRFPSYFSNLTSVSFIQGTNQKYFVGQETAYQFNNIVVTAAKAAAATAVPEPGTLALLGSGLLVFTQVFRRKLLRFVCPHRGRSQFSDAAFFLPFRRVIAPCGIEDR